MPPALPPQICDRARLLRGRWLGPALVAAVSLVVAACAPKPAVFPDDDKVMSAEKAWCQMLGQAEVAHAAHPVLEVRGTWRHQAACEAAFPSSSADFLGRVTPCYEQRLREGGDAALDGQTILEDCSERILVQADPGDLSALDLVHARCERALRCEKVPFAACQSSFAALSGGQRAGLTVMYNEKTQAEIAACLRDSACGKKSDDAARDACYAPARKKGVFFAL